LPVARGSMTGLAIDACALKMKAGSASTSETTAGQGRPSPRLQWKEDVVSGDVRTVHEQFSTKGCRCQYRDFLTYTIKKKEGELEVRLRSVADDLV
jgi:hypothetical protein